MVVSARGPFFFFFVPWRCHDKGGGQHRGTGVALYHCGKGVPASHPPFPVSSCGCGNVW